MSARRRTPRFAVAAGSTALIALVSGCGLSSGAVASLQQAGAGTSNGTNVGGAGNVPGTNTGTTPGGTTPNGTTPGGTTPNGTTPGGTAPNGSVPGGTTPGGTTPGGTTPGGTNPSSTPGTTGGSVACATPNGGTTTGLTATSLNIGLHAPLTGTGTPFPNSSFESGSQTFWQQAGHTICGRKVTVDFQDDTYTPSGARTVCSAMAKRDFLVLGGGGTDQIQACATDPDIDNGGVPYLSAGVTTNGLTSLPNYFAVTLTYQQQGALVVRNAINQGIARPAASTVGSDNMPGKNAVWAIVTANTKNFDDATQGIQAALNAAGIPYKTYRQDQNGNYQAAATQFGQTLALDGFRMIFMDAAPGYFVFATGGYYGEGVALTPNWVGPGVTYSEVTVAQYICSTTKTQISGHAWFLAPGPGIDHATQDFKTAYGGKYDDIEWSLWGLSQTIYDLLKNADTNLTRQNFIATTRTGLVPAGEVYPSVDFRDHGGHFGGTAAWAQRVNCGETEPDQNQPGQWDTVGSGPLSLY